MKIISDKTAGICKSILSMFLNDTQKHAAMIASPGHTSKSVERLLNDVQNAYSVIDAVALLETAKTTLPETTGPQVWPASTGWHWAYGRNTGMKEATVMAAFAAIENGKMIVYVGEGMTYRLSMPDVENPLQFKPAVIPSFDQ